MTSRRASAAIRKAEQDIRGLLASAATAGEYEAVVRLNTIARRLADMAAEVASEPPPPLAAQCVSSAAPEPQPAANGSPPASRKGSRRDDYPRFERSRDLLVKVGWSRKARSEYVHRVPKAGVHAVLRRVLDVGKGGRVFTTDELLPVRLGGDDELPGYQAYVCLAWLRTIGAIKQHGREGYSVVGEDVVGPVDNAWESLPLSRR